MKLTSSLFLLATLTGIGGDWGFSAVLGKGTLVGPTVELEPFVVTGTAVPLPAFEAASDIALLEGSDKLIRQTANLGETLEFMPGVATINTGSGVGLPVVRGLSGNRIRVLQDSIGVNYQQFGVRHPPNIDPLLTGRIEVVRGVSSILYGSDAFGGAINAISPEIPFLEEENVSNFDGRTIYRYETGNELQTGSLSAAYAKDIFGVVAGVVHRDAGNLHVPNVDTWNGLSPSGQSSDIPRFADELNFTDYEQWNAMFKAGYRIGPSQFSLRFERWDHENNYLLPNGRGIGVDLENNQFQAIGNGILGEAWKWKGTYTWNQNLRQANPGGSPLPVEEPAVNLERNSHTLRAEFTYGGWEDGLSGAFGMEGLFEDQKSSGMAGLTPGGQVENLAVFGMSRYAMDNWSFEGGLRFDHRSQEADPSQTIDPSLLENRVDPISGDPVEVDLKNDYDAVTASLGVVFHVTESFAFASNINRGFRAPGLFELYASGVHGGVAAIQFGEAGLDTETSSGGDLQARWRSGKLDWTATAYVTAFRNFIFLADTGATDAGSGLPIFKVGQAKAELYGADFSIAYRPTDWLTTNAVYEAVRGEFDSGEGLPLLPADQLQVEVVFKRDSMSLFQDPEFRVGVRHAFNKDASGPQEPFSQFDRNPNFGTASTQSYTLLDVAAGFVLDNFRFDIAVKNVTDEAYRDFLDTYKGYALSPGRSFQVQVSFAF